MNSDLTAAQVDVDVERDERWSGDTVVEGAIDGADDRGRPGVADQVQV